MSHFIYCYAECRYAECRYDEWAQLAQVLHYIRLEKLVRDKHSSLLGLLNLRSVLNATTDGIISDKHFDPSLILEAGHYSKCRLQPCSQT